MKEDYELKEARELLKHSLKNHLLNGDMTYDAKEDVLKIKDAINFMADIFVMLATPEAFLNRTNNLELNRELALVFLQCNKNYCRNTLDAMEEQAGFRSKT
jgi:hypothetical protein